MDNVQQPPEGALKLLRERPDLAPHFDEKYGQGAAARFLTPEDDGPGFFGTVADVASAIPDAVRDGVQETLDLTKGAADWLDQNVGTVVIGGPGGFLDYRSPSEMQAKPAEGVQLPDINEGPQETAAGNMVHGITQFITGYALGGRMLRWAKPASAGGKIGKAFAQGAAADFIAFDEHEARLSNIINEHFPEYSTTVTEYLAAKDDDPMLEGRLKNMIEGGLTGIVAEGAMAIGKGLFSMVKATRQAKKLAAAGKQDEAMEVIQEASEAAEKNIEADPKATYVAPDVTVRHAVEPDEVFTGKATLDDRVRVARPKKEPDVPADILKESEVDAIVRDLGDDGKMFENLGASGGKGGVNARTWMNAESALRVVDAVAARVRERTLDAFEGTQSFDAMKRIAANLALNPAEVAKNLRELGIATKDMPSQLLAADMIMKKIGNQISAVALKYGTNIKAMPPEAAKEIQGLTKALADIYTSRGLVQKHAARTVAAGNVIEKEAAGTISSAKGMLDAITEERDINQLLKIAARHGHKPTRMVRLMHGTITGKALDKVNEFWINALLSHPRTHMINMLSGGIETVIRPLEDALGRALTGDLKGATGQVVGAYHGLKFSLSSSRKMMSELIELKGVDNMSLDDLSEVAKSSPLYSALQAFIKENNILDPFHRQYDVPDHAIKGAKGKAVRTASRFLSAEDEFMKQMNYRMKIMMDEYAIGYRNGMKSDKIAKNIADRLEKAVAKEDDLVKGVSKGEGIDETAMQYARETTFTSDLEYGMGKSIQGLVVKHPILRQFMPFVRVPVNLFRHSWQRFPGIGLFQRDMRQALFYGTAQQRGRAAAKQLIGLGLAAEAWNLALEGKITGYGPKDPNERRQWLASGKQPYSYISSDGTVIQFNRLDPRFTLFGLIADMQETYNNLPEGDRDELLFAIPAAIARNVSSKSFYTGIAGFLDAAESGDAGTMQRFMQKHIGSYVPNVLTMFTSDEIKAPNSVLEAIMARTPGLDKYVDPKRNVLGEAQHQMGALGPDVVSPIFMSKLSDSRLDQLMTESRHGYTLPSKKVPGTRIDLTDYENDKGQSAWDRWQELTGTTQWGGKTIRQSLEELVPQLEQLPATPEPGWDHVTSVRDQTISQVIGSYREVAFEQMLDEFPGLREKINQQKTEGAVVSAKGPRALQELLNH